MTKDDFQNAHGEAWAQITANPAFFAAMQLVSAAKLTRIATLTDEEIQTSGKAILADFRGHLGVENALIELAVAEQPLFSDLPPETYADPNGKQVEQPFVEPTGDLLARFKVPSKTKRKKK